MEEIKSEIGEQLEEKDEQTLVQEEQIIIEQDSFDSGSPQNKFKTVESLKKAYEDLEKAFTKKCQLVKELENKKELDKAVAPNPNTKDWTDRVCEFFSNCPKAKDFIDEISEVLSCDKVLAQSQNSLELAYAKVLDNKYKPADEIIKDDNFINQVVLKDKNIREKIIEDYLSEISNKKTVPLMSRQGESLLTPNSKPKNLEDAGRVAKALFKN